MSTEHQDPSATEDEELIALRAENADLKHQMQLLGEETEKLLRRRNHTKPKPKVEPKVQQGPPEVRAAIKINEDLRREKLKLAAELQHGDTARRIAEMKNQVSVVDKQIEARQKDIRALENVGKAQKDITEMAQHSEQELKLFRAEHRQELNNFKEEMADIQLEIKGEEKHLIVARQKMHVIEDACDSGEAQVKYYGESSSGTSKESGTAGSRSGGFTEAGG